ncbi:MAG TPA: ectoine/hydroxyectoine ABC transporter ATP-binding protein EhuA [Thermoanaerobaculia bacterium]|nr:ectoine/hydroxyectoine ABC transporter ATP-binding protein EhuA [Thermoanaerobaculia bacterium]
MRGVEKRFGDEVVLRGLDLDVPRGEKLAVIGGSGSGKSTILRILMTLEGIDGGRVEIDGDSVFTEERDGREAPASEAHLREIRRKVGMVFQHFNLFPHMTALGNVMEAPRRVLGLPKEEAEARARELLDRVGLAEKADAHPARLSGGQQQRVAIARALAMRPEVMLFDEVTSGLDPELVGEVLDVLRELARAGDMTMLIVTHQMHFAREIADRVVFLEGGSIVEEGAPEAIFTAPEKERTREFLQSVLEA